MLYVTNSISNRVHWVDISFREIHRTRRIATTLKNEKTLTVCDVILSIREVRYRSGVSLYT